MPPSTEPEPKSGGAWKVVSGCFCVFFLACLGLMVGGYVGGVISGPVRQYGGEWQGLGALRKLFDTIQGAFWGTVAGASLAVVLILFVTRKKDDRAEPGASADRPRE